MGKSQGKLIISLYVDDLLVLRSESNTQPIKMNIEQEFEITDLGLMNYTLKM